MFCENFYKIHLQELRESHKITMSEAASLLSLKTSAGIRQFEAGRGYPSYNTLIQTAVIFGVSLDWITGLSDIPYTETSIMAANKALAARKEELKADSVIDQVIQWYLKENKARYRDYTGHNLALTGNIIFLTHATFLQDLEVQQGGNVLTRFLNILDPVSPRKQLAYRKQERYMQLLEYFLHGYDEPLFKLPEKKFRIE